VTRELFAAAGLKRDRAAAGEVIARNALVSQGFARSSPKGGRSGKNAEIRQEGDRGGFSLPEVLSGGRSGERALESV
jgi:hypothetical protein